MTADMLMSSIPILLQGLEVTLVLSLASIVGATLVGLLAAVLRTFGPWGTPQLAKLYTELFRGSPVLITLMFIYFGVSYFGYAIDVFAAAHMAFAVSAGDGGASANAAMGAASATRESRSMNFRI